MKQNLEEKQQHLTVDISDQIKVITDQLAKQEQFIQNLSREIKENNLEKVMQLLKDNREFVTSDFIASKTGHYLATYLLASATDLLLNKYPFLHIAKDDYRGKKVFYIGNWYKANTRRILYLNVNLNQDKFYSLDLNFDKDVLLEWDSMDEVKNKTKKQLQELEIAYKNAKKSFDSLYADALVKHKQQLEEAQEELEYLNTKMLKKQSDIEEVERQIAREEQIIAQIQNEPEIYFQDADRDMHELEAALKHWRQKNEHLELIEALVKREKNEIANYLSDYKQFTKEIKDLSALFGTVNG